MSRTGKMGAVAVLVALAAAVALLALVATTQPADAAGRYKTVTKTFSNTAPITIPDTGNVQPPYAATPYPSEISVGGLRRGTIRDANLTLKGFSHTFPGDVDVMVSHREVNRTVMSDVGGGDFTDNITLTLDDEAASPLPDDAQLTGGTFKPTNVDDRGGDGFLPPAPASSGLELSGFDGKNPNGPWQLWVVDDGPDDGGQFGGGWKLTIKARVLR